MYMMFTHDGTLTAMNTYVPFANLRLSYWVRASLVGTDLQVPNFQQLAAAKFGKCAEKRQLLSGEG